MNPYYDDGQSTIYHADCLDVLPTLADVGLVLTSPPYNLSGDGNKPGHPYSNGGSTHVDLTGGYGTHDDAMPHAAYVAWQQEVLRACWSILVEDGAIFYNHKPIVRGNTVRLPLELVPEEIPMRQIVTWDRGSGFNRQFTYFVPTYEIVPPCTNSRKRQFGGRIMMHVKNTGATNDRYFPLLGPRSLTRPRDGIKYLPKVLFTGSNTELTGSAV